MRFEFLHHIADVFLLCIAIPLTKASSTEVDHDAHIELVHFGAELIDFFLTDSSLMTVNVYKRKFCSGDWILGDLERGGWIVFLEAHFLGCANACRNEQCCEE